MPVFVRNTAGNWVRGNNPSTLPLWVKVPETVFWRGVGKIWLRDAGIWKQLTDYVGTPGAPTNLRVTTGPTTYDSVTVAWDAPTTGAPVTQYFSYLWDGNGNPIDQYLGGPTHEPGNVLSYTFGAAPDQRVQVEVTAVSSAGAESQRSNRIRWEVGHPQQTQQVPVSGWGTPYDTDTATEHGSSELAGSPVTNSTDYNWSTQWLSAARPAANLAEGTRIYGARTYRRVHSVKVWPNASIPQRVWLGMHQNGAWYGQGTVNWNYLNNPAFWSNSTNVAVYSHPYFLQGSVADQATFFDLVIMPGYDFLMDRCTIDVAVDMLKFISGGYRAAIAEIIIVAQDWTTTYVTQETVAQKNNGYW